MISYKPKGLTLDVLRLIEKLPASYCHAEIIKHIEKKSLTPIEVRYDDRLYGILIVHQIMDMHNRYVFIVDNVIAENNLEIHFSNILSESLENWLFSLKTSAGQQIYKRLRVESDRPGVSKMLSKIFGRPIWETFEKDVIPKESYASIR